MFGLTTAFIVFQDCFFNMRGLTILACLVVSAAAVSHQELVGAEWSAFKALHGKEYQSETEEYYRMKIYMENRLKIARHNAKYANNEVSYKLAMNEFGDLVRRRMHSCLSRRNWGRQV